MVREMDIELSSEDKPIMASLVPSYSSHAKDGGRVDTMDEDDDEDDFVAVSTTISIEDGIKDYKKNNSSEWISSLDNKEEEPEKKESSDTVSASHFMKWLRYCWEMTKYVYSWILLLFSISVIMAAIFTKQTNVTSSIGVPPVAAFFIFWILICWLAVMEGGQGCLIGLQPVPKELYTVSHPVTLRNTKLVHSNDNMERFVVGRQFLVVLVVFIINQVGGAVPNAAVLGLPEAVSGIFLTSGVAVVFVTVVLGQLMAQVNAAKCMLDFSNSYFVLFTAYVSLAIEASGLLHCVYLVQICVAKFSRGSDACDNIPHQSTELDSNHRSGVLTKFFFWIRVLASLAILAFSFAVTFAALFNNQTTTYNGVPNVISVLLLFALMAMAGIMEGMQIALFAVANLPTEELNKHPLAATNCRLVFTGNNLGALLIGRQICVTACTFIVARITTINVDTSSGLQDNVFGVSNAVQSFFNTGLLGAIITTIVASLAWRIVASTFPVAFLSNPLIYFLIRFNLLVEGSGLCSSAWSLAYFHKIIARYREDEVYIGSKDERQRPAITTSATSHSNYGDDLQLEIVQ